MSGGDSLRSAPTSHADRIALIGLPGAGKTTIGKLLAGELGWALFDCDAAFEAQAGAVVAVWVGEHGWDAFRERESALLGSALARDKTVIATGGGVVEDERNRSLLAGSATVVWLDAPLEVLFARLGTAGDRPLLAGAPCARLRDLAERRNPLYAAIADLRVDAADPDPAQVLANIVHALVPAPSGRRDCLGPEPGLG